MSHQPFETWLLDDEPLETDSQAMLNEHLAECDHCRKLALGWQGAQALLRATLVSPAPGFSDRWKIRLDAARAERQRRQSIQLLVLSLSGAFLLMALLVGLIVSLLRSPDLLSWMSSSQFYIIGEVLDIFQDFLLAIFFMGRSSNGVLPLVGLTFAFGLASQLLVLWFISLRRLTSPRRVRA